MSQDFKSAIYAGNVSAVSEALADGTISIYSSDPSGIYPVHHAAIAGSLSCLKILAESGAILDQSCSNGKTVLHFAAENNSVDIIKYMVDMDADINATDSQGHTPLHLAALSCKLNAVNALLNASAAITVNDTEGRSPLHLAASNGAHEVLKVLLAEATGFSSDAVDMKDEDGNTPFHLAAMNDHFHLAKDLMNASSDPNSLNNDGRSPLHLAAQVGSVQMIKRLHKCSSSLLDYQGNSILHLAAESGSIAAIRAAAEKPEIQINATNHRGQTALHIVSKSRPLLIKQLLRLGFDESIVDDEGYRFGMAEYSAMIERMTRPHPEIPLEYDERRVDMSVGIEAGKKSDTKFCAVDRYVLKKRSRSHRTGSTYFREGDILCDENYVEDHAGVADYDSRTTSLDWVLRKLNQRESEWDEQERFCRDFNGCASSLSMEYGNSVIVDDEPDIGDYNSRRVSENIALDARDARDATFDAQEKWAREIDYEDTIWCPLYSNSPDAQIYESRRRSMDQVAEWQSQNEERFRYADSNEPRYSDEEWIRFWSHESRKYFIGSTEATY